MHVWGNWVLLSTKCLKTNTFSFNFISVLIQELDISIDNNTLLISKEIFNESFAYSRNDKEAFENINGELVIDLLGVSNTNKEVCLMKVKLTDKI